MRSLPPFTTFRRTLLGTAGALTLALFGAGCGMTGPTDPLDREKERLEQARAQWRAQGFQDYSFTFRRACFCVPSSLEPVVVAVRRGAIISVTRVADGSAQDPSLYFTVEGLFDLLEGAIDQDAARLDAAYDAGFGYPTSGFIDRSEMIADEEFGFQSSDLRPQRP